MARKSNIELIAILALLALIVFAVGAGGKFSMAGAGTSVTVEGTCPDSGTTNLQLLAYNPLDDDKAQIVTSAAVYMDSSERATETVTTASSGYVSTTEDPNCGEELHVIFGDGSNYYYVDTGMMTVDGANYKVDQAIHKVGSVKLTLDNSTTLGQSSIAVTMNPGETNTEVYLHVKGNTADAYFGDGAYAIVLDYNISAIDGTKVTIPGATEIPVPSKYSGYEKAFEISHELVEFAEDKLNIAFALKSDATTNTTYTITGKVMDKASYLKLGKLIPAYEDEDYNDIGATDGTFTITVNVPA